MVERVCRNYLFFTLCIEGNIMEFFMVQVICNQIKRRELKYKKV